MNSVSRKLPFFTFVLILVNVVANPKPQLIWARQLGFLNFDVATLKEEVKSKLEQAVGNVENRLDAVAQQVEAADKNEIETKLNQALSEARSAFDEAIDEAANQADGASSKVKDTLEAAVGQVEKIAAKVAEQTDSLSAADDAAAQLDAAVTQVRDAIGKAAKEAKDFTDNINIEGVKKDLNQWAAQSEQVFAAALETVSKLDPIAAARRVMELKFPEAVQVPPGLVLSKIDETVSQIKDGFATIAFEINVALDELNGEKYREFTLQLLAAFVDVPVKDVLKEPSPFAVEWRSLARRLENGRVLKGQRYEMIVTPTPKDRLQRAYGSSSSSSSQSQPSSSYVTGSHAAGTPAVMVAFLTAGIHVL